MIVFGLVRSQPVNQLEWKGIHLHALAGHGADAFVFTVAHHAASSFQVIHAGHAGVVEHAAACFAVGIGALLGLAQLAGGGVGVAAGEWVLTDPEIDLP